MVTSPALRSWLVKKWWQVGWVRILIATNELEGVPVILARGLKQLQVFDVLAREKIVLTPVILKAMSYSWAGIRSGIAEKQALHKIFEWVIATSMGHEIHWMPLSEVKTQQLHLSTHIWEASCMWGMLGMVATQGQDGKKNTQDWSVGCRQKL